MIEIIIYMMKKTANLKKFRKLCMNSNRCEHWKNSCFYDTEKNLKFIVFQWLDSITRNLLHFDSMKMLVNVSKKVLKKKSENRSKFENICADFSLISLKIHLITICDLFHKYAEKYTANKTKQISNQMKLWFENDRRAAFDYVIFLNDEKIIFLFFSNLKNSYDEYIKILKIITIYFQNIQFENFTMKFDAIQKSENSSKINNCFIERFENDICKLLNFYEIFCRQMNEKKQKWFDFESCWTRKMFVV